jgi:hypothetical protein
MKINITLEIKESIILGCCIAKNVTRKEIMEWFKNDFKEDMGRTITDLWSTFHKVECVIE